MITIFNRKELFMTFSMEKQAEIRNILKANKIDYHLRIVNTLGSARGRTGSMFINMDYACEYIFYVHTKNFETATALINGRL